MVVMHKGAGTKFIYLKKMIKNKVKDSDATNHIKTKKGSKVIKKHKEK